MAVIDRPVFIVGVDHSGTTIQRGGHGGYPRDSASHQRQMARKGGSPSDRELLDGELAGTLAKWGYPLFGAEPGAQTVPRRALHT